MEDSNILLKKLVEMVLKEIQIFNLINIYRLKDFYLEFLLFSPDLMHILFFIMESNLFCVFLLQTAFIFYFPQTIDPLFPVHSQSD